MTYPDIILLFKKLLSDHDLIFAVFSSPKIKQSDAVLKATLRPIIAKGEKHYQLTSTRGTKEFHATYSVDDTFKAFEELLSNFKQGTLYSSEADYHLLCNKKGEFTLLKRAPTRTLGLLDHNRKKQYLLPEGKPIPFLVALGVMGADGKVISKKSDKFRQVNRFVEMIDDVLPHLNHEKTIEIVDFGCGKGYLTFALYHYLRIVKGMEVHLVGMDLKQDVVEECQKLADKLGYEDLKFIYGDIKNYSPAGSIDLVIALHACDTATDAALEKAISWNAQVILAVPCCQHELYSQVQNVDLEPLLRHGILKERFASLVTDAARANLLELKGYTSQILEFIDMEHTPKNLLIRAVKNMKKNSHKVSLKAYQSFKRTLNIDPCLERLIGVFEVETEVKKKIKVHMGAYGFLIENNQIFLVTMDKGPYRGKLALPGGGIEFGEPPEIALRREFLEEVEGSFESSKLLDNISVVVEMPNYTFHHIAMIYEVEGFVKVDVDANVNVNLTSCEPPLVYEWYDLDKLNDLDVSSYTLEAIKAWKA